MFDEKEVSQIGKYLVWGDSNMNILICDDDLNYAKILKSMLEKIIKKKAQKAQFTVLDNYAAIKDKKVNFDIAFLDIDMGAESGIDIARSIREKSAKTVIIFVTGYIEYAPDGYEVGAFRYLLKSQTEQKLEEYFDSVLASIKNTKRTMNILIGGEIIAVKLSDILYIESEQRVMIMHLNDINRKEYQFYKTMKELEEELARQGFLRIQKSYLVNMEYIKKLQISGALLKNGTVLSVSAQNYAEIKNAYLLWRGKQ